MSNRFERLFQLPPNLHSADSPVILLAGVLLRDTQSQKVLVQLKFKNISSHKVKAVKVHIAMYDVIGERIGGTKEYQYLDLGVNSGDVFGSNKAIILPNAESKSFAIESLNVVLDDNLVQDITMPLAALPDSESLEEVLKHPELFKQFRLEINEQAIYAPQEIGDTWSCSCGEWNGTEECSNCGANKEYLFSVYDPSFLINKTKTRLRKEKEAKEAQEEQMEDSDVEDSSKYEVERNKAQQKLTAYTYCRQCNSQIKTGVNFCRQCGARVDHSVLENIPGVQHRVIDRQEEGISKDQIKHKLQNNERPFKLFKKLFAILGVILLVLAVCVLNLTSYTAEEEDIIIGKWNIDHVYMGGKIYDIDVFAPFMSGATDVSLNFYNDFSMETKYDEKSDNSTWELVNVEDNCRLYSFGGASAAIDTDPNSILYNYLCVSLDDSDDLLVFAKE